MFSSDPVLDERVKKSKCFVSYEKTMNYIVFNDISLFTCSE